MIVILSNIPTYLYSSRFYKSLNHDATTDNEENDFTIPDDCMKKDLNITSDSDARELLQTLRFWISDLIPYELFDYLLYHKDNNEFLESIYDEYSHDLPYINTMRNISKIELLHDKIKEDRFTNTSETLMAYQEQETKNKLQMELMR
jgi:hypothetical protein